MTHLTHQALRTRLSRVNHTVARLRQEERGDVPGWVLVTIMTAGLVAVLWAFAEPYLSDMLRAALDSVVR